MCFLIPKISLSLLSLAMTGLKNSLVPSNKATINTLEVGVKIV